MTKPILVAMVLAVSCTFSTWIHSSHAQEQVTVTPSTEAGAGSSAISRRTLQQWAEHLALDAEQKAAALALHEGYLSAREKAQQEFASQARLANAEPGESLQRRRQALSSLVEQHKILEKALLADIRSVLTVEQQELWPRIERLRRRELVAQFPTISGDNVDLRRAIEGLKLEPAQAESLEESLEQYELELDRAVQARLRVADQGDGIEPGGNIADLESILKRMPEVRETASRLKEIHHRHARKIESLLPEDLKAAFAAAIRLQAFPGVYRQSLIAKHVEVACGFDDLDSTQRQALEDLKGQYQREVTVANSAWSAAIEKSEARPDALLGIASQVIWTEEDPEVAEARTARRQVDERARQKLALVLRPEQRERLPKAEAQLEMVRQR